MYFNAFIASYVDALIIYSEEVTIIPPGVTLKVDIDAGVRFTFVQCHITFTYFCIYEHMY